MTLALRPYQREAVDGLYAYFGENAGNPLVVIPTAGGKSLIMAQFIREVLEAAPGDRILIVTHVKELIRQNFQELVSIWPEAPAGIYSAGIGLRQIGAQVLFAGIQSIHAKAYALQKVDLVLVDEAHLIPRKSDTMYRRFLNDLLQINPYLKVVGLTATPYRLDSGRLDKGDGALFEGIAYDANVADLVSSGYLAPVTTRRTKMALDTSGVAKRGGEFVPSALEAAVDKRATTRAAIDEVIAAGVDRRSWLVFGSGINHCEHIADEIAGRGVDVACIFGDTPKGERDSLIDQFKAGRLRCLVSMGVLTTGFNAPSVDLLVMLRPTMSAGLYVQMIGRGMRNAPGKSDCLVLDFAGNIDRHGPIDCIDVKEPGSGDAPVKDCPECKAIIHAAALTCPNCGHEFPPHQEHNKLTTKPTLAPVLAARPEWVPITSIDYHRHEKEGGRPSMRVTYHSGFSAYREWVCFEHSGYTREKAVNWWRSRAPAVPVPNNVNDALADSHALARPAEIAIRKAGKWFEVVGAKF